MSAPSARLTLQAVVLGLTVVGLVAGCTSGKPAARVVTVTVPPSSGRSSGRPAPTATTRLVTLPPAHLTRLRGTCDSLLPDTVVSPAIGGAPLVGVDAFVVGTADATIGRLGYLNCRYGVTGTGDMARPKIEIGVSLYATAARAAARIRATIDDYTAHGAAPVRTSVAGLAGVLLTGGGGLGYDLATLVVASGQRTVAVSLDPAVATGARATSDEIALATIALARTAR